MCNCDNDNAPSCFVQKVRRARVPHRCCECDKTIAHSQRYEYTSGIWDGSPDSFCTCLRCVVLRMAHIEAEEAISPFESCHPIIGDIRQTIGECAREEPDYVVAFRKARRKLLAALPV